MPLTPGTRLGPYEIVAPLGAGGMGEVYRAKDTRLGRDVAVKVLPQHLSANPEARARFEREAMTVSSLNHPSICTLFDVGRAPGEAGSGDTDYLVMELIEGETLAQRLARGALPTADVLRLGGQIAEALDRAHRAGVIHRDLKPGNVMLTKSGAKLMDFGLARTTGLTGPGGASAPTPLAMTQAATVAAPLTAEGTLVGTFEYMAPEQLEGREVDARGDVWALGCVLYEMAAGRRAFEGASQASLISAIMKDEPRPLAEMAPLTPAGLDRVVRACLAKDPAERWQSTHDLATALRWIDADLPATGAHTPGSAGPLAVTYRQLTFRRGSITNARFAPDGRTVLYDAAWEDGPRRVYMTRTESPETTELSLPSAALLDVSPSGEMALSLDRRFLVGWWLGTGMLAQAPLFGGAPREIQGGVSDAAWSPDGRSLAVIRRLGLQSVLEFPIGNPVFAAPSWLNGLRVSPDGLHAAFLDYDARTGGRRLKIVDREGKLRVLHTAGNWPGGSLAWRADGKEVFFGEAQEPDGATISAVDLEGRHRTILRIMGPYAALHDVSASGELLLSRTLMSYSIGFSRPGQPRDLELGCFDISLGKDLSVDGRTLLFDEQGVAHGREMQTSIRGTDGSPPVRLGPGLARGLSPDGRWVINTYEGRIRLLPCGAGKLRVLDLGLIRHQNFASWHPDGERIVFVGAEPDAEIRLFVVPASGGVPRPVTPEGVGFPAGTIAHPVSADGTRVFALSADNELCVYELEGGAQRCRWPLEEDEEPIRWNGDDHSIFIWRRGDVPIRVQRIDVESGARSAWRDFVPADRTGVVCSRAVQLTPDGETCAYTYTHMLSELFVARGLV